MRTIFIIQDTPEASDSYIDPQGFTTLESAQEALRKEYNHPEQRSVTMFRDEDYTYYYIERVEVAI